MPLKSSPYIPSFLRSAVEGSRPLQLSFSSISDTNIISTSSFKYDPADAPLKSTQQLNVDWENFENHTFFSSAEVNVNSAFDQIINGYPFDGTKAEHESFFEKLTGFEKWVFDQFPKYRGQLHFSGTKPGEDTNGTLGTWIATKDYAGALFPEISKNRSGGPILEPKDGASLSIEAQIYVPNILNGMQVVCQKLSSDNRGFSLYLTGSSTSTCHIGLSFVSGSSNITTTTPITKGRFNHICAIFDRDQVTPRILMYSNEALGSTSRTQHTFNNLNIDDVDFLIGSGTSLVLNGTAYKPSQTFSGSIDELRVFHSVRTLEQQQLYAKKSIFPTSDLKLYYRFNEPAPALGLDASIDPIIIDSSGNSLHATINNAIPVALLRQDASLDALNPLVYEKLDTAPVLFPGYADIIDLNTRLLTSATLYDAKNPNLITRLIPTHYLQEGAYQDGFNTEEGTIGNDYAGTGMPGEGKIGSTQIVLTFLYMWARFFDDIKLYVDSFSTLKTVDYNQIDTIPDNFLNVLVSQYGFYLPPMFNDTTIEQYIDAENIDREISTSTYPLKYVQQQLLRRVLINMPDVIRSKGTQHSIKAFLRAIGIDPENSVRIREYGGPSIMQLAHSRETKREMNYMLDFSNGLEYAASPYLSASRVEVGFPYPTGTMSLKKKYPPHGISNNPSDGLLTSGSWTIEGIFSYPLTRYHRSAESIVRLCTTGSCDSKGGIIANLLAMSGTTDTALSLFVRSGMSPSAPMLTLVLSMSNYGNLYDGDKWNFSFGRERADAIGSHPSASYYLRVAKNEEGKIAQYVATSSFFQDDPQRVSSSLEFKTPQANVSGCYIQVGPGFSPPAAGGAGYLFLNNTTVVGTTPQTVAFNGRLSNLRFWSKALTETEWKEHVRNYKSTGVQDPLTNYNFARTPSGSFERLRLNTLTKQENLYANTSASLGPLGAMTFIDFSQNGMHLTGTNFTTTGSVFVADSFEYSYLSPYFDEASTSEKIRVRSYQSQALVDEHPWSATTPVYEVLKSETPTDDARFAIEFSLVDALNRDIVTMFSTFDALDNMLGDPSLLFSPDYPDLERLRDVYFNRLSEKLNFKEFFEFFRWFDMSIGTFIEQLIPRKTRFKGTNFVIESHMLERHKMEYHSADIYVDEEHKQRPDDSIMLQLFAGVIRKY